jgi:hypothetical protein
MPLSQNAAYARFGTTAENLKMVLGHAMTIYRRHIIRLLCANIQTDPTGF